MVGLRGFAIVGVVLLTMASAPTARADYPDRTIRIVVPYPAGGSVDITARLLATSLSNAFKQTVIVENRAGADGMIASRAVANSEPNGHTLLIDSAGLVMNPSLYSTSINPLTELAPVARLIAFPYAVVVHHSVPTKSLMELGVHLKQHPGKFNVATSGATGRLVGELFRLQAGVDMSFIPYRGSAPAITATLAGETQLTFSDNEIGIPPQRLVRQRRRPR